MKHLLLIITTLLCLTISANDGIYYTSGNELIPMQETDIRVQKEVLTISLGDDHMAKVDVYYEFHNATPDNKTIRIGFEAEPPYNTSDKLCTQGIHPYIKNFTVNINGNDLTFKNAVCQLGKFAPIDTKAWKLDSEMGTSLVNSSTGQTIDNYAYVYYFDATFKPGINRVHHTYRYTMSQSVGMAFSVPYKLSPATRWAGGKIGDFKLIIRADNTAKHFVFATASVNNAMPQVAEGTGKVRKTTLYGNDGYWEVSLRNGALTVHLTDFSPKPENELNIQSADVKSSYDEVARFGAFYDRSTSMSLSIWSQINHKQQLSTKFLKRIAHNLPYANRGHVFRNTQLKKYFESLWWYMPDATYTDSTSDFTTSDWDYIKY